MSAGEQSYASQKSHPALAVATLTGTTAVRTRPFFLPFLISEFRFIVTTAVTVTAAVITVNREIKYGVATSQIAIGTFTVPLTGSTIGDIICYDARTIADTFLAAGEGVSFTPDGASTAGAGWCGIIGYEQMDGPFPFLSFSDTAKPRSGVGSAKYGAFTQT